MSDHRRRPWARSCVLWRAGSRFGIGINQLGWHPPTGPVTTNPVTADTFPLTVRAKLPMVGKSAISFAATARALEYWRKRGALVGPMSAEFGV